MLTLYGVVHSTYRQPDGMGRDGKPYTGGSKVQLLCDEQLSNGESRTSILTLGTSHQDWFDNNIGQEVQLPVGALGGRGQQVTFFISKGWSPPDENRAGTDALRAAGADRFAAAG